MRSHSPDEVPSKIERPQAMDGDWLANHILNDTAEVWNRLSQEPVNLIGYLIEAGIGNSVSIPFFEKFNQLQKMHLVVSYEKET